MRNKTKDNTTLIMENTDNQSVVDTDRRSREHQYIFDVNSSTPDSDPDTPEVNFSSDLPMRRWNVILSVTSSEVKNGWWSKRVLENVDTEEVTLYATDKDHAETLAKNRLRLKNKRDVKITSVTVVSCIPDTEPDMYVATATAQVEFKFNGYNSDCPVKDVTFQYFYPKNSKDVNEKSITPNAESRFLLDVQKLPDFKVLKTNITVIVSDNIEALNYESSESE